MRKHSAKSVSDMTATFGYSLAVVPLIVRCLILPMPPMIWPLTQRLAVKRTPLGSIRASVGPPATPGGDTALSYAGRASD